MSNMWCLSQNRPLYSQHLKNAGISQSILNILQNRGYHSTQNIVEFLRPSLFNFHSPFLFNDMQNIIHRLEKALHDQEKVLVYGDYDVDGVSGTALIYKVLNDFGFQVIVHIPSREEGYGLHQEAIQKAAQNQVGLIITVDCGITAVEETLLASELGIDVIITDHHEPPENLPMAVGILNPKMIDSGYPFRHLAGVGVAFKLVQAIFSSFEYPGNSSIREIEYLDLAALGTIADIVPLIGENRIIAKFGLQVMENTKHTGIKALLDECGLKEKRLKAGQISFIVAPRINAAGRMDTARLALNLLLEEEYQEALEIAKELSSENYQRQLTEKNILEEAKEMLAEEPIPEVIVLSSPTWHHGVIGIVASRLVELFHRPVYLICEEGELGKGSARGIPDYHVYEELVKQAGLLSKFGGHQQAAGFTIPISNIDLFRKGLTQSFVKSGIVYHEKFMIDAVVPCDELGIDLQRELEQLGPFGAGNPAPVLMTNDLRLRKIMTMGKNNEHLKLMLYQDKFKIEALAFKRGDDFEWLNKLTNLDILYALEVNDYMGNEKIQAVLKDYRQAAGESLTEIACSEDIFELSQDDTNVRTESELEISLNRDKMVEVYKTLRSRADQNHLLHWGHEENDLSEMPCIQVFEELGILEWYGGTGPYAIRLNPDKKTDLLKSFRYRLFNQSQS